MRITALIALTLAVALAPLAAPAARAQGGETAAREALQVHAYSFEHRQAIEALPVIQPLLSRRGTIELRPADNTLVIRDSLAALATIVPALERFDRPARPLAIEVIIIRAQRAAFSPVVQEEPLPPLLARRLAEVLPYSGFRVLARTELRTREGERVTYELGEGFGVRFRSGSVVGGRTLRLADFRVTRRRDGEADKRLIHSNLSLLLDRPMVLTLASTEASATALVVVLTPRLEPASPEVR